MMAVRIRPLTEIYIKGKRRRNRVMPSAPGQRRPRMVNKRYKALIATLPSVVSGTPGPSIVAHLRYAEIDSEKDITGIGRKPSDMWTLPLAPFEHADHEQAQHNANERKWWAGHGIDPVRLCKELWACNGNFDRMLTIVENARQSRRSA
jgi:hypothetical protein